jgi:hypothetical protein
VVFTFHADEKKRGYYLHSEYNPDFVDEFKEAIHWGERKWIPERKLWWVDKLAFEQAKRVCEKYGPVRIRTDEPDDPERERQEEERRQRADEERRQRDAESRRRAEEQERQRRERQRQHQRDWWSGTTSGSHVADPYATLHLRQDAPWPVVRAAYRALVALHHPSSGHEGERDEERMKAVNLAYEAVCKQRGEKK